MISEIPETNKKLIETIVASKPEQPRRPIDLLEDMSPEEVAILVVVRGWKGTKKELAEKLGVGYRTIKRWPSFSRVWNSIRTGEKLGEIKRGLSNGEGGFEAIA
ncbi:ECF-type sigma factor family protein [Thalassoglobus neptunius]|uniref:hypothetical protein n=1 Tax=Thalassoglobus neptunius TaxID=1938619 RepID=UPI0011B81765|nr:hypothetical protein [Thalassoglobus neptunius]